MLSSQHDVFYTALVGFILSNLIGRSPSGHLSLNVLSPNLRNRLEPFIGQLIN